MLSSKTRKISHTRIYGRWTFSYVYNIERYHFFKFHHITFGIETPASILCIKRHTTYSRVTFVDLCYIPYFYCIANVLFVQSILRVVQKPIHTFLQTCFRKLLVCLHFHLFANTNVIGSCLPYRRKYYVIMCSKHSCCRWIGDVRVQVRKYLLVLIDYTRLFRSKILKTNRAPINAS